MTITRLREIAAHHELVASSKRSAARFYQEELPEVADKKRKDAAFHEEIARDLTELADAFASLEPLLSDS